MTYYFKTYATMKPYNRDKWWIDSDIVKDIEIEATNISSALKQYAKEVSGNAYIDISKSALKNKNKMYRDTKNGTKQVGYVITGKADFRDDINYKWVSQFIDLWVEIMEIKDPVF